MKHIGILIKPGFTEAKTLLQQLVPWLKSRGRIPLLDPLSAELVGEDTSYPKREMAALADLLVVLGGDGTMLAAARLLESRAIPILGVNTGGLGFLTEVTPDEIYKALESVFENAYTVEERLMLRSRITRHGQQVGGASVLNDVVLSKGTLTRMVQMEIRINSQFVTGLRGDGLIISTPTGSTAYSLSSGGPILNPSVHAVILTPICPHTLTNRPIVIPQDARIEIFISSREEGAMATFDGQVGIALRHEDMIEVGASDHYAKLIRFPERTFYEVLRKKLKWGDGT
ncbi:MAG TPA: NAD(+)/NADH kinase [Nitrospirales bacterium]|jgi:NAD+ kinase